MSFETRCPGGCHSGDFADFDHYCDDAGIKPGDEPVAFAAWLEAITGEPVKAERVGPDKVLYPPAVSP